MQTFRYSVVLMVCMCWIASLPAAESWCPMPDDPGWQAHFVDGKQVGARKIATGDYWAYDAATDSWARSRTSPELIARPGLVRGKLDGGERWRIDGYSTTEAEALAMLATNPQLPDDTEALSLTVIGPPQARALVARDLVDRPELQRFRGHYVFQGYAPTDPMVRNAGFVVTGQPTIYVQTRSGDVLARSDRYDGPGTLARVLSEAVTLNTQLRRPDPTYRPQADDSFSSFLRKRGWFDGLEWWFLRWVLILVGTACFSYFAWKKVTSMIDNSGDYVQTRKPTRAPQQTKRRRR